MAYLPEEELTPDEAARFALLPRAAQVDDLALERTIAVLREQGLLNAPKYRTRRRAIAISGSIAAALVLFASGVAFGQRMSTASASVVSPADQVQQAGSAYVAAVVRLSQSEADSVPATVVAGLQAGTATLHAAAASLSRLNPADPELSRLRTMLEFASSGPNNALDNANGRLVVWF